MYPPRKVARLKCGCEPKQGLICSKERHRTGRVTGIQGGEFNRNRHKSFQFLTDDHGNGFALQGSVGHLPDTWILLDNKSAVDVCADGQLLENIQTADTFKGIHCESKNGDPA
jgi:hypothetical protein